MYYVSPGVNDHRMTIGLPAFVVDAYLVGSYHVALVLYGTGAQERLPVGGPRLQEEGAGDQEHLGATGHVLAVKLGVAQVVRLYIMVRQKKSGNIQ